jgi:hypothetical protein
MALVCTFYGGGTMPEFTTVSLKEATLQTSSARQKRYLREYIDYITMLPKGQAGKLRTGEEEKHATIRRRLGVAAKTLGISLIIKRSGNDLYFWKEDGGDAHPSRKRSYTRRSRLGSPGSLLPPTTVFTEPEAGEQGIAAEETTELDQTFTDIE